MGKRTLSQDTYSSVRHFATSGGSTRATFQAEERLHKGLGMDPLVDPKGPEHLGPVRRSLPRFDKQGDYWLLTSGMPMAVETLLDTTGSMGDNVDKAFDALPQDYKMLTSGKVPVLDRYDVQIATGIFNDTGDNDWNGTPVLCRTQFEMDEKIAMQMTHLIPGGLGGGNGKEDPQFGLFGAAYLTEAAINRYGLKYYHFTVSDEPIVEHINYGWLKKIFGDDVLDRAKENGFDFKAKSLPRTAKVISSLQERAHAFFLQVNNRPDVTDQWQELYGADHFIMLPYGGTRYLHCYKAVIIGLTEGILTLSTAEEFLAEHGLKGDAADQIVRAVAHIPLGVQSLCENYGRLPKAGDLFKEKTDLWPIDPTEVDLSATTDEPEEGANWL